MKTPGRKTGAEPFTLNGTNQPFGLLEFWQWSASDLVSNLIRGRVAEFIVAQALGISTDGIRAEWDPCDLITSAGLKVEVKSGAFLQSWTQSAPSVLRFQIPETRAWSNEEGKFASERRRQADVYVFAVLAHDKSETLAPLKLDQWEFYVVPTHILNARNRASISLKTVKSLSSTAIAFNQLSNAISKLNLPIVPAANSSPHISPSGSHAPASSSHI